MTINTASGLINWTPATADVGTHPVTVTVTDGNGGSATQSYTLTVSVAAGNQNPVITTTAPTSATENITYTYDVEATDADGDTLTYNLTTSPTGMTINTASGLISWTPATADVGTHAVTVTVTDGNGGSATQSYTLTVSAAAGGVTQNPWQDNENGYLYSNSAWDYTMGYRFTPNVNGQVTQLGGYFNGTKMVKLWDAITGQILTQASVTSANDWQFVNISPIDVQAGSPYIVGVYLAGSGASYRVQIQTLTTNIW